MRIPRRFDHRSALDADLARLRPCTLAASVREPDFSPYFVRYFRSYLPIIDVMLERYVEIVAGALAEFPDLRTCTFVDFGGGTGFRLCWRARPA